MSYVETKCCACAARYIIIDGTYVCQDCQKRGAAVSDELNELKAALRQCERIPDQHEDELKHAYERIVELERVVHNCIRAFTPAAIMFSERLRAEVLRDAAAVLGHA